MGDRLTESGWPQAIAAFLIPQACREEVLGDLHERNTSAAGYILDALRTVPMVVASRIRRTADPRLLALHAIGLYFAFYMAGWHEAASWRLAIPCAAGLVALVLEDAYAGRESRMWWVRGPVLAMAAACVSEAMLWAGGSSLALPGAIVIRGSAGSLVWTLLIRVAFQPPSKSRRGPI